MIPATGNNVSRLDLNHQSHVTELADQITELAAHINAATCRLLELIREFDDCKGWFGEGMQSCAHWLNWQCGINLGAAREKIRVAHALVNLPNTSDAFTAGRISYSKVRAITRVATSDNEDYLLMIAEHGTAAHVERLVSQYRKVKRIEALERDNQRHELREFNWFVDDDGYWVCRGRFTPEQGAVIANALKCSMETLFTEQQDVSAETPADEISAKSESVTARRADAMVRLAESFLTTEPSGASGGDLYQVHIHTDIETLKGEGTGAESDIEGIGNVSAETSRRLACDSGIVHWQDNSTGNTLDIGRKTRSIPPSIRRALRRRDGGCRFPGCTATHFVDAHHIRHWADGGPTSIQNLVFLCRQHHRLVHEGGFGLENSHSNEVRFTNPLGRAIPDCPKTRFRGNAFSLFAENAKTGIEIRPGTAAPRWYGDEMDDSMAVDGLLQRE